MAAKNYLIYGVSKGLGKTIALHVPSSEDRVYGVSCSRPTYLDASPNLQWIPADLSKPEQSAAEVKAAVGDKQIDCLIYNVGIWEAAAFSEEYDFLKSSPSEITNLINTNVSSCILAIQSFILNLRLSDNAKVILIGSTWGLDNHNGQEVAFSASKFALRGIVHALRESLKADRIGVSILNLGYLATEYGFEDTQQVVELEQGSLIPLSDVIHAIRFIIATSNASCVKEIDMPAMRDIGV